MLLRYSVRTLRLSYIMMKCPLCQCDPVPNMYQSTAGIIKEGQGYPYYFWQFIHNYAAQYQYGMHAKNLNTTQAKLTQS